MFKRFISITLVSALLLAVLIPNCVEANEGTYSASMSVTASTSKPQIVEPSFDFPITEDDLFRPEIDIEPPTEEVKVPVVEIKESVLREGNITKEDIDQAFTVSNDFSVELIGSECGFESYVEFSKDITKYAMSKGITSVEVKGFSGCEEYLSLPIEVFSELRDGFVIELSREGNIINFVISQDNEDVTLTNPLIEVFTTVSPVNNMLRFVSDSNGDKVEAELDDTALSFKVSESGCFSLGATEGKLVSSKSSYTYSGRSIKPGATMVFSNSDIHQSIVAATLMSLGYLRGWYINNLRGTEYTVSYSNNKDIGTGTIQVQFSGKLSGCISTDFEIVPKGTTIRGITTGDKSVCIKFNKQTAQSSGYQIEYSTNSDFQDSSLVNVQNGKSQVVVNSLKSDTVYYAHIRTYKSVQGVKYYSAWSKSKKFKTK